MGQRVAIVGGGSIGVAWATAFARARVAVSVFEPDATRRDAIATEVAARLRDLASFELLDEDADVVARRIEVADELASAVEAADHVQECAPEDLGLKRRLFADLDASAPMDAVLASSSSALRASEIAGGLARRERCLVAHPGNPPYLLPVVELVPAPFTTAATVERATATFEGIGMSVVVVGKEVEGFVFNRLQGALLREAYCLVRDGVATVDDVDRLVRDGLGRRWSVVGPFETVDLNTRGGIEAHAARMGPAYERMGADRGQHDPWTPELVREVAEQRRALLPLERWDERVRWRDRALMALERARHDPPPAARPDDRVAITTLLHRYCAMLDRMELDLVPSIFTRDCVVVYGDDERMQSRGADSLQQSLRRLWRFARTSHHLSNVDIEFPDDDAATASSYVLAWHQYPDGRSNTIYAHYSDRLVRTADGWRISERRQFTHGTDAPWDRPLQLGNRIAGDP